MVDREAMEALSYGMFVLTCRQGDKDNGCVINTAMEVTTSPERIVFTVNKNNYTCELVRDTGVFTLSVLSQQADFDLYRRFGFASGRNADKFAGFEAHLRRGSNGLLRLTQGVNAWLEGRVVSMMDLGTHLLFLADVEEAQRADQAPSATYAYYHAHVKPAPDAPAARGGEKRRWVCKVCGYIYEGDELPADFICPLCKHPASDFEPME